MVLTGSKNLLCVRITQGALKSPNACLASKSSSDMASAQSLFPASPSSLHLVTGASFCSWNTPCSLLPQGLCIFWLPLPGFFPSWIVYLDPSGSSKRSHHTLVIFPSPKVLHEDNLLYALLGLSWEFPSGSVSSVQSQSRVRLFATLWTAARQASLSITNSRSLLQLMSIESVMPANSLGLLSDIFSFSLLKHTPDLTS